MNQNTKALPAHNTGPFMLAAHDDLPFRHLAKMYVSSPEWMGLSVSTRRSYSKVISTMVDVFGDAHIQSITRQDLLRHMIGGLACGDTENYIRPTPINNKNMLIAVARVVFQFAVDIGHLPQNPASGIKPSKSTPYKRWPDYMVKGVLHNASGGLYAATLLGVHTGQRLSDVLRMRWIDVHLQSRGDKWPSPYSLIKVRQKKTGLELHVPLSPDLESYFRAANGVRNGNSGNTIVLSQFGKPYTAGGFSTSYRRLLDKLRIPSHRNGGWCFHGLRKTCAARLAEAGCSAHEIMAITGHKTLRMVDHYTKGVNQVTLAGAAMAKMERVSSFGSTANA